jgi:ATP-binding protein involved in chromosome partitioning
MSEQMRERIIEQLRTVNDPELHKDLVSLDMIKDVSIDGGSVKIHVELTTPACPMKDRIGKDVTEAVKRVEGVETVGVEFSGRVREQQKGPTALPGVRNVFAVGAGKGGVGKSTVAAMLGMALHREGAKVGILDADVYGPSIPTIMGVEGERPEVANERLVPIEAAGIKGVSMGFLVERDRPLIWRGPMVHGVIRQFLEQVAWGKLDYLIVDLPPGTGDVPLTLAQTIPMTGAVVVCTPQDLALLDARRAVLMYAQLNVPCLGIIENMSYYLCPKCGHRDEIFDHGGAEVAAGELGVPFLGAIPLNGKVREHTDSGRPEGFFNEAGDAVREGIETVSKALAGQISVRALAEADQPTVSIE